MAASKRHRQAPPESTHIGLNCSSNASVTNICRNVWLRSIFPAIVGSDCRSNCLRYLSPESRIPKRHPLRPVREMVDIALSELSGQFESMYSDTGRRSIPPEKLLRALLLQILYSIRSERMLCEQLDYNLLFRWFIGLSMDDPVWDHSTFSKNRDRLLESDIARGLFDAILAQAEARDLTSDEHFTVNTHSGYE